MDEQRIQKLKAFLKEDPEDPFLIYALANEYAHDKPAEALKYYRQLLQAHENYTATYYHAANLLAETGSRQEAEQVFLKGLEVCKQQQDTHALRELQGAYTNFLYDDNDE